ncbi:MAG: hypothetical protein FWE15_02120 [Actinomycetia bacterium]|nr:hypothetical protein [Actinomycetes bacterium]
MGVPYAGFPCGRTVTVIRRAVTGTDDYGNDVYGETAVDVPGCSVDPAIPAEEYQATSQITADYTIHLPPGVVEVDGAYDELDLGDGRRLTVIGVSRDWQSPWTGLQGVQEVLARWVSTGGTAA